MKMLIAALLISGTVQAAQMTISNRTGYDMRITMLHNRCEEPRVTEKEPVYLTPGAGITFGQLSPVVQSIEVCGVGICVMSAIGMKNDVKHYQVDIILDHGFIDYKVTPDHWTGTNVECPK